MNSVADVYRWQEDYMARCGFVPDTVPVLASEYRDIMDEELESAARFGTMPAPSGIHELVLWGPFGKISFRIIEEI